MENFTYDDGTAEEFDDRISNVFREAFDGIKFYKVLHYTTLMILRILFFFRFFIGSIMTFRLSGSLSRSFVSRACIIVSLCRTSQIKRCHSWEIKDEESSAGKNYCLSSFFLSVPPPRSFFVFLLRSLSRPPPPPSPLPRPFSSLVCDSIAL